MKIGDIVKVKNIKKNAHVSFLITSGSNIGMIIDVWSISKIGNWLRILWSTGSVDSIHSHHIEVISESR